MGYYTYHELGHNDMSGDVDHESDINKLAGYSGLFEGEATKWYDHEKHMREYSKRYPLITFELNGEGEETGDIWVEYYRNGKMQRIKAQIKFDPFDESKLV